MKHTRLFLLLLSAMLTWNVYSGNIQLNGISYSIDTVAAYPVGPGSDYIAVRLSHPTSATSALDAFILRVDTRNPYVSIEQELGGNKVVGVERPSAMAQRITTAKHIAFAGTNGDFFATTGDIGRPTGLTIENNEYAYIGSTNRRVGGVTADGRPVVATNWKYTGRLYTAGLKDTLVIKHVNYSRNTDELVLYNQLQGATTGTNQYGTELLVELCEGEQWKTNGRQRVVVRRKEQNKGSMSIPVRQAVLSGHGAMQQALDSLVSVGDTLTVRFTLKLDDVATSLSQAIGGDNYALILDNGVAEQSNFWNELHPRTGYGVSMTGDTAVFCVVDGRSVRSAGCTTKVLGEIMRHYGAWRAVNWDGGGSSSMYIRHFGNQVNNGSDLSERAVGNAMFAVANLPEEDNTISQLYPYYPIYSLPYCGYYTPHFLGYNKYGVLLDPDVDGVQLTCDPTVGEVQNGGRSFFASSRTGGKLTASFGNATTEIEIRIVPGNMRLRLDSVVLDSRSSWQVEVVNVNKDGEQSVAAPALDWQSLDEQICSVDADGVLTAAKNGETQVVGSLGNVFSDTLLVRVQTPAAPQLVAEDCSSADTWKLSSVANFNPQLRQRDDGIEGGFTFAVTRKPYVLFEKQIQFFGLPDTIRISYSTDAVLDNMQMTLNTAAGASVQKTFTDIQSIDYAEVAVPVAELLPSKDKKDHYPLSFTQIRFYLTTSTSAGDRYIRLHALTLCYQGIEVTSLQSVAGSDLTVYPVPASDYIRISGAPAGSQVRLMDVNGRTIHSDKTAPDGTIDVRLLSVGVYLLQVDKQVVRVIKK